MNLDEKQLAVIDDMGLKLLALEVRLKLLALEVRINALESDRDNNETYRMEQNERR